MAMRARFALLIVAVWASVFALIMWQVQTSAREPSGSRDALGNSGRLHVPTGYRSTYEFLGVWAIAGDPGSGAKELHVVYASPGTVAAYRKGGRFPQGAVLVKEVHAANTRQMTTGLVSRVDTLKGWFVMVKGAEGSFPGNALWGDGWGWSWFDARDPQNTTSTDYRLDCKGCHVPAQSTDWIYVDGYPALKR
jgi:hypothetical protein